MKKLLSAVLLLAMAMLCAACGQEKTSPTPEPAEPTAAPQSGDGTPRPEGETAESPENWGRTLERNGETWRYNSRLRTVLFMGVDSEVEEESGGVGSGGRSDTLILFIIDPDAETLQMMPISRDTMTRVDVYDRDRNHLFSGNMQITMQYSFGDSPARSCQLTKRTVSGLLHGIPIHNTCSLTLEGMKTAVELAGGITLRLEEDWTDIDPAYTAGSTVIMQADTVERFLRYRDTDTFGSNNDRMRRQSWFIRQLFAQIGKLGNLGVDLMLDYLDPYLETDLDGDTIKQLIDYTVEDEVLMIPGENVAGKKHDEFHVDDTRLQELLLQTFYRKTAQE